MLDLLLLTSSIASNTTPSTSGGDIAPTYTDFEIYFWYIALLIMIVLTVIFLRSETGNKKKMTNITNSVNKGIQSIDSFLKDVKANKQKLRKLVLNLTYNLDSYDVSLIEIKEKTRLDDFVKIMTEKEKISKDLKELLTMPFDEALKHLNQIRAEMVTLKGQMEIVVTLIK